MIVLQSELKNERPFWIALTCTSSHGLHRLQAISTSSNGDGADPDRRLRAMKLSRVEVEPLMRERLAWVSTFRSRRDMRQP